MLLVRHAKTPDDFVTVHSLLAEMGAWDAETVALLGLSSDDVIPTYYAEDPEALQVCFTSGDGRLASMHR